MNEDQRPKTLFSEPEAQRILARAVELEAVLGKQVTEEELRRIAESADIDAHALEHAMNERRVDQRPDFLAAPASMSTNQVFTLALTGAALGAAAIVADNLTLGKAAEIAILGPTALATIYRAMRYPLRGGLPGLLRELGVLMGSFSVSILAIEGLQASSTALGWSAVCGALGAAILAMRRGSGNVNPALPPTDTR